MGSASDRPLVIVMGVAGSGKSTVGRRLAKVLDVPFIEGDDFHAPEHLARMARGEALTGAERGPWLDRLAAELGRQRRDGAVLACSALTRASRKRLGAGLAELCWVWIDGPASLLRERLCARRGHPVGVALLASQLATLEPPSDAIHLDAAQPADALVAQAERALQSVPHRRRCAP